MEIALRITNETELDGILTPHSWSKKNVVKMISLQTPGESEFIIDFQNSKGKELVEHVGKRVIIRGEISSNNIFQQKILVNSFTIYDW
jgi:hypothetical protein